MTTILYGNLREKKAKLVYATLYKDTDNIYYMRLEYDYYADDGKHRLIIPKAEFPFGREYMPVIDKTGVDLHNVYTIESKGRVHLWPSCTANPKTRETINDVCLTDYLIEPATKKMTIDEIEKALGYKIEIVNKKED